MPFLDDLGRRMTSSMDLSRLQSAVNEEERVRQGLYTAIGEQYTNLHKDDPEEALAGLIGEIKASFERSDEYRRLIRNMKGLVQCPNCGADMPANVKFCIQCGAKMPQPEPPKAASGKFCMYCGAPINEGAKFCSGCGSPIAQPKPEAQSIPEPQPEPVEAPAEEPEAPAEE